MIEGKWKVTESTAKAWHFRFEPLGWAIYTVNDSTGEFSIQSDWGNYSYRWSKAGIGDRDFLKFLATANADYIARKFAYDKPREFRETFDSAETEKSFREAIILHRKEGQITREVARECWEEVDSLWQIYLDNYDETNGPILLYEHFPDILQRVTDSPSELLVFKPSRAYQFCVEKLIPFFQDYIRPQVL